MATRALGRNDKTGVAVGTRVTVKRGQQRFTPKYPGRTGVVVDLLPAYPDALYVCLDATAKAKSRPWEMFMTHNLEVDTGSFPSAP